MQIYTNKTFDQSLISNCVLSELEARCCKCSAVSKPSALGLVQQWKVSSNTPFRWLYNLVFPVQMLFSWTVTSANNIASLSIKHAKYIKRQVIKISPWMPNCMVSRDCWRRFNTPALNFNIFKRDMKIAFCYYIEYNSHWSFASPTPALVRKCLLNRDEKIWQVLLPSCVSTHLALSSAWK